MTAECSDWQGLNADQPGEKDTEECTSTDVQRSFIFSSGGMTHGFC